MTFFRTAALAVATLLIGSCNNGPDMSMSMQDPGALVGVQMNSTIGVLLDEIPASMRDRVAADLMSKGPDFWVARAKRQINLTTYKLVFRAQYYAKQKFTGKDALPITPDSIWNIQLAGAPTRNMVKSGHDYISVPYTMTSTILTDVNSPCTSDARLCKTGGKFTELFTLPIDPELVFQRTRFACLDEGQFPPHSVDSEEVDSFYDDSCGVESMLTNTGCHQTELPTQSCGAALDAQIGSVATGVTYTRLAWSSSLADQVRVGPITNTNGSNLTPEASEFRVNRLIYRYIPPNDCALVEQCVGAPGWRRLLQFSTADRNTGTTALNIGSVDYFISSDAGTPLSQHNVFEYSACHHHYHFTHYGTFSFNNNAETTSKRGFCLQATDRFSNIEVSPLPNPYANCWFQGIMAGWVDEYKAGLPCQWIDVTGVNTSKKDVTGPLSFQSNPDGFLCEGTPVLDAQGNPVWEPTSFTTADGGEVDRPKCNFFSTPTDPNAWLTDNTDTYNVTIPAAGLGYVTKACTNNQIGPLRNCEFSPTNTFACTAGAQTHLHCTTATGAVPQVARVCDYSTALAAGVSCTYQDSLANSAVDGAADLTFTCPVAKDSNEPGGHVSLYTAAVYSGDATAAVTCTLQ
jgi:hypothetical protein